MTDTHWLAAIDYNEFGRCWEAVCDCFDPDPATSGSPVFRDATQVDAINLWAEHAVNTYGLEKW